MPPAAFTSGLLVTRDQLAPRSVLMYMPPWYCNATMRPPSRDTALEIQTPDGLLPVVQVAPPSLDTCSNPVGASPPTSTSPPALLDSECHTCGVGSASVQVSEGATVAAIEAACTDAPGAGAA